MRENPAKKINSPKIERNEAERNGLKGVIIKNPSGTEEERKKILEKAVGFLRPIVPELLKDGKLTDEERARIAE